MANQTANNVSVAIKREVTPGVAAAPGAGATRFRILDSPGLEFQRGTIENNERRDDMIAPHPRLGGINVGGSYNTQWTIGGATHLLWESIVRNSWRAAVTITEATNSAGALTVNATNQVTRAAGSWLTDPTPVKVGDVVTFTNLTPAGNNDLRLRVTAVTALVLTFAGAPLTVAASDAAWTMTILKKLVSPVSPLRTSYTIEQFDEDIGYSEVFIGCRLTGVELSWRPRQMATIAYTFLGMDSFLVAPGQTPYFTSPTLTTGRPLVADDSAIRHAGVDVAKFTGLDLSWTIDAAGQDVIGSMVTPDIFDNVITMRGTLSAIREDHARLTQFRGETEFDLSALFTEPGSNPRPASGLYLPSVKFLSARADAMGGSGAKIETLPFSIATREAAAGYDASAVNIFESVAA